MHAMTVGQVARLAGVGAETIRFYEKNGLLAEPTRGPSNYRVYGEETVDRIRFIQRAKGLGFTLAEIKELLPLRVSAARPCARVRKQAEAKISELNRKVALLRSMKQTLRKLLASCEDQKEGSRCLVLDVLDGAGDGPERTT
jgi:MerR family transcriptional regulator, copper efflux regulator